MTGPYRAARAPTGAPRGPYRGSTGPHKAVQTPTGGSQGPCRAARTLAGGPITEYKLTITNRAKRPADPANDQPSATRARVEPAAATTLSTALLRSLNASRLAKGKGGGGSILPNGVRLSSRFVNGVLYSCHHGRTAESAFFTNNTDDFSARAIDYVTVSKVKREDFYDVIKFYKTDLEKFNLFKDDFLQKGF